MADILDGKDGAVKVVHSWTRYRAHLHAIDIKRGTVIVPLNRINSQFEYLEEVHFERFTEGKLARGLLNYIHEYWNIRYDTVLNSNDTHIVHELYKETGLAPIPVTRQQRHYEVLGSHFVPWAQYFPSYTVSGVKINQKRVILFSPYPDEIAPHDGFTVQLLPALPGSEKPRVKINLKV